MSSKKPNKPPTAEQNYNSGWLAGLLYARYLMAGSTTIEEFVKKLNREIDKA